MPDFPMSKSEKYYDRLTYFTRECNQNSPNVLKRGNFIYRDGVFEEITKPSDYTYTSDYKDEKLMNKFEYHPFQEYYECEGISLYEKFANLDTNDINSISEFIKEFGFLRIGSIEFRHQPVPYRETLSEWQCEILLIKCILLFISFLSIDNPNKNELSDFRKKFLILFDRLSAYSQDQNSEINILNDNFKDGAHSIKNFYEYSHNIKELVLSLVKFTINDKIKNVHPALYIKDNNLSGNKRIFGLDEYWKYNTLLESMYLMIYMDLLKEKRLIMCVICGEYFKLKKGERYREYCYNKECRISYNRRSKRNYARKQSKDEGIAYFNRFNKKMNKRKNGKIIRITNEQYKQWLEEANNIKNEYLSDKDIEKLKKGLDKISNDELFTNEEANKYDR